VMQRALVVLVVLAVLLVQLQLLLDCADGEVARWRKQFSPVGVYLDQLAHYSTEAAIPAALGVRADGGWDSIGGWTALGLLVSVLILFLKSETHLVQYALSRSDRPAAPVPDPQGGGTPRLLPRFRPFQAVEASFLALAAAIGDSLSDGLGWSRALVIALAVAAGVAVLGHLAAIMASSRLK